MLWYESLSYWVRVAMFALSNLQMNVIVPSLEVYYAACTVLGISATAQERVVIIHATSENQGAYLSTFWIIFNSGAASGGVIGFIMNFDGNATTHENSTEHASGTMYAVFIGLMSAGVLLSVFGIVESNHVIREDSTLVSGNSQTNELKEAWWVELQQQFAATTTKRLRAVLCLLPLFAYSNWFYAYHSFFNISVFNVRTSGLASSFYWLAQMRAAYVVGKTLDSQAHKRTNAIETSDLGLLRLTRQELTLVVANVGIWSLTLFSLLANATWAIGFYLQSALNLQYDHSQNLDVTSEFKRFLPPFLLYVVYGWNDALCQVWIYLYMGSIAERDAMTCGRFAGIYKGVQAISAAIAWYIGAVKTDPETQLIVNWLLCNIAMLGAYASVISFRSVEDNTEAQPLLKTSFPAKPSQISFELSLRVLQMPHKLLA